jgi:hypothetical protein
LREKRKEYAKGMVTFLFIVERDGRYLQILSMLSIIVAHQQVRLVLHVSQLALQSDHGSLSRPDVDQPHSQWSPIDSRFVFSVNGPTLYGQKFIRRISQDIPSSGRKHRVSVV